MKHGTVLLVFLILIVGYFVLSFLLSKKYSHDLAQALAQRDYETARKMLFSKKAIVYLNAQSVSLMRASYHCSVQEYDEALRYCEMIQLNKLPLDKKISFYMTMFQIALQKKDKKMAQEVLQGLKSLNYIELQQLIERNEIQYYLSLEYDSKVIELIHHQLKHADGHERGMLCMSLAKAYHLNHQKKDAVSALMKAKDSLNDETSLQLVDAALNNLHLLD